MHWGPVRDRPVATSSDLLSDVSLGVAWVVHQGLVIPPWGGSIEANLEPTIDSPPEESMSGCELK